MRTKLKVFALGALLTAGIGLAGCNDIEAQLPKEIQSLPILAIEGEAIPNNELEKIFEAVTPSGSDTAAKVLDTLLLKLAESYFGTFYGENGIRAIVKDDAKIQAFVDTHSRFQVKNEAGERVAAKEIQGVKDFYARLVESLQKSFWGYVSNTSYQERSIFNEKKFYDAQKAALYVFDPNEQYHDFKKVPLDGNLDHTSVGLYFGEGGDNYLDLYQGYIERALIPDLYRTVIVENYLQRNNYLSLGRSQARKVQTITLKDIETSADATRDLVTCYARYVLEASAEEVKAFLGETTITVEAIAEKLPTLRDLKFLSRLYSGTVAEDEVEKAVAAALYARANWEKDATHDYYPLTTLGHTIKDYYDYSDVRWETSSTTDFTGSGAYTRETGLEIKIREQESKTLVTEGWFTSSGLSDLPSAIRSRLFKFQVANDVDSNYTAEFVQQPNVDLVNGVYRSGAYYLTPETYPAGTEFPYLIYDYSSTSWVIVRVDEAVKGPKLADASSSTSSYNYLASKGLRNGKASQNQIVWEVCGLLSGTDSYVKAARQEVLKESGIKYHDQNVYDYFETTFPDLFD